MGYRTQYFTYLWRRSCVSLRIHHGGSCTKPSNCSDEIKMSKSTTGCQIESFIPIENMNVEKLRATKSNRYKFSQAWLKWIQKSASLRCLLPPTLKFSFYNDFCKLRIITKDSLIDSWSIYNLIGVPHPLNLIYIIKFDNFSGNVKAGGFPSAWKVAWKNAGSW